MRKTTLAAAAATLLSSLAHEAALAQQQTTEADAQRVIVTSQKRREDVRQVPLAVSVMSGEALKDNQIIDFTDLARSIPNLSYSTQAGAGLATLQLRGVSSQAGSATVSIYLDDVSLTTRNLYSQGTAEPRFFDLDRIEVLRGPQGTLYGASSLGGTIRYISKQPDMKTFGGGAMAEVSSTAHGGTNHVLQGVLNLPLSPAAAVRLGVQTGRDSGYIDRVDVNTLAVAEKGINSTNWDVFKLNGRFNVNKDWSVSPALFIQRFKSNDIDASYTEVASYQSANVGTPLAKFQTSKIVREPGKDTLTVPSVTVNGDVGYADFTGILSGYKRKFDRTQDGTYVNSGYIGSVTTDAALGQIVGFLPSQVNLNNKVDQTSLELRLASKGFEPGRSPLTWIAGAFMARTLTEVVDDEPVIGINAAFRNAGIDIEDPTQLADTFPGAFLNDSSYYSARHYRDSQRSLFGEVTYHFSPSLRATAGLRVLRATQKFTREGDRYYAGGPTTAAVDSSASATTPRFALSWDLDNATSVYANVAKGFRLGSANRPVPDTPLVRQDLADLGLPSTVPAAFKPDSAWSFEVGSKSRLWGGRLNLNVAAFHIRWDNIQQTIALPLSAYDFETNVGKATSSGLELEARLKATDQLTLEASGALTHAVFSEDTPALGFQANGDVNVHKGDRIQGVPRYNARLAASYRFEAFAGAGGVVRLGGTWTGNSIGSLRVDNIDHERPGYFVADASAGLTFEKWDLTFFVKNLLNNDKVIQQPAIQSVPTVYKLRPRTMGVTAVYNF